MFSTNDNDSKLVGGLGGLVGLDDCQCFVPESLKIRKGLYKCDKKFHTESIMACFEPKDQENMYGLLIVHGEEAQFYSVYKLTNGKYDFRELKKITEYLPKNHDNGGQSQNRYQRLREEAIHQFLKRIAETSIELYTKNGLASIKGLGIAGTGPKRNQVPLPKHLSEIVVNNVSIPSVNEKIENVIPKIEFEQVDMQKEQKICGRIFDMLQTGQAEIDKLVFCKPKKMIEHLKNGFLESLVIHQDSLAFKYKEQWEKLSSERGCSCHFVKHDDRILNDFGGIVGILWYPLNLE